MQSMELDEIIYSAITANETLVSLTGGRIKSTFFDVPPYQEDNTPIPYIVIYEDPGQNNQGTKDDVWESGSDIVNVSVEFSGNDLDEAKRLRRLIRKAVDTYVKSNETDIISVKDIKWNGIQDFGEKPCYVDTLHYSCEMLNDLNDEEDEQEN